MATAGRKQPPWQAPKSQPGVKVPAIKIYNSLTQKKEDFVPSDPEGRKIKWYQCGVTPYSESHIGHAANYVRSDVIRRILQDYFKYEIQLVQNITDVDDKIILRGRQQKLIQSFKDTNAVNSDAAVTDAVRAETEKAWQQYFRKQLPLIPADTPASAFGLEVEKFYGRVVAGKSLVEGESPGEKEAKIKMHINTALSASEALQTPSISQLSFYTKTDDVLMPYLDSLYGSTIDPFDHTPFSTLTRHFEASFDSDMQDLNVLKPDVVTRATEYIPQMIEFIETIIKHGFAYPTSDGSVYFSIQDFERAGHPYARLEPWSRNDAALQADGEGALSKAADGVKRNDADFAIWKGSKSGEMAWNSPWGSGRPGWHIECSVMASDVLGKVIDIHTGGEDLRFPHHDNELAQSEAYWATKGESVPWINYFLHMGHLGISGAKMSKSLKNFTTIKSALQQPDTNARRLRLAFMSGQFNQRLDFTDDLVKGTASLEAKFDNFFINAKNSVDSGAGKDDAAVTSALERAKEDLDRALLDSFDTPAALRILSDLVSEHNSAKGLSKKVTQEVARWITRTLAIFGLDAEDDLSDNNRIGWSGIDIPSASAPFVYPASQLRDELRVQARSSTIDYATISNLANSTAPSCNDVQENASSKAYAELLENFKADVKKLAEAQAPAKELLALADQLRDTHLWNLSIYLEDRDPPLPAIVRPLDSSLVEARNAKESAAQAKAEAKAKRDADESERKRLLAEKSKTSHLEMYKTSEYKAWDEQGIPTQEANGDEITKSKKKKLSKEWERQKKLHEEYLKSISS